MELRYMGKLKYLGLMGGLILIGCSSETINEQPEVLTDGNMQTINLQVISSGDRATRGGRVLTSSESANEVEEVDIAIYQLGEDGKLGNRVFARSINWQDSIANLKEGQMVHINLKQAQELMATKGLRDGKYRLIATGHSLIHDFSFQPGVESLDASSSIPAALIPDDKPAEEVFAGGIDMIEVKDGKFASLNTDAAMIINLRRQVAGTFGYFINIPARGFDGTAATDLRLVASSRNNLIRFAAFNNGNATENIMNGATLGSQMTSDAEFSSGAKGYVVYQTKLSDWFPNGDVNGDGILNDKDANYNGMSGNWRIPEAYEGKLSLKIGSVFSSSFIVPILCNGNPTFELQLISQESNGKTLILRRWSVTTSETQKDVKIITSNGEPEAVSITGSALSFSVLRNHIYTIGKKTKSHGDAGGDPDSPEGEEPQDLNKGQIIVISVNDNWEEHNQLIIKPII